jgi:phosphoenolpyruvate synthase/pyruvate phosphate dikinase
MLTKDDLRQIKNIIAPLARGLTEVKKDLIDVKKDLIDVKKRVRKIEKTVDVSAKLLDSDLTKTKRRVLRIEDHLGIPTQ